PAAEINPGVPRLLREIGIELGPKKPRTVTPQMIAGATRVVTFGCLDRCPIGAREKSEDWPIPGATDKTMDELRAIRDELRRRVADELGPGSGRRRRDRGGEEPDPGRVRCPEDAAHPLCGRGRGRVRTVERPPAIRSVDPGIPPKPRGES